MPAGEVALQPTCRQDDAFVSARPDCLSTLSWDEGDSTGSSSATRHPQFYEADYKPHDAAGPSCNKLSPGHPGPPPLSPASPHSSPAAGVEGRAMRLHGAGVCGRASLRWRRRRPRGQSPVRPRTRCGRLLSPRSAVFVCGGVEGKSRGRAAPLSARCLPGRVGASPRLPPSPPPREDARVPRRPPRAWHAAPARRRRSHMPAPQPCEQAAPAPLPHGPQPRIRRRASSRAGRRGPGMRSGR